MKQIGLWICFASFALGCASNRFILNEWPPDAVSVCRDELFENPKHYRGAGSAGLLVAVDIFDECELEKRLVLINRGSAEPELRLKALVDSSLEAQLNSIRLAEPQTPLAAACQTVVVETRSSDLSADRLRQVISDFKSLRLPPTIDGPFVIHGTFYEVWVFSGANRAYFEFQGASMDASNQNPLQQWVDELVQASGMECHR